MHGGPLNTFYFCAGKKRWLAADHHTNGRTGQWKRTTTQHGQGRGHVGGQAGKALDEIKNEKEQREQQKRSKVLTSLFIRIYERPKGQERGGEEEVVENGEKKEREKG